MTDKSIHASIPKDIFKGRDVIELEKLMDNDDDFSVFFSGLKLDSLVKVQEERERITTDNRSIAQKTTDLKPDYDSRRERLANISLTTMELNQKYNEKYQSLKQLIGDSDQDATYKDLVKAVKKVETETEECAADFLSGKSELSLDDFLENYLRQRTSYWLRKVKADKLLELRQNPAPNNAPGQSNSYAPQFQQQMLPSSGPPAYASLPPSQPAASLQHRPQQHASLQHRPQQAAMPLPPYPSQQNRPGYHPQVQSYRPQYPHQQPPIGRSLPPVNYQYQNYGGRYQPPPTGYSYPRQ